MGGLNTEALPPSLPEGASPRVINCDFNLGRVFQRPGKQSAFTYGESFFTLNPAFTQSVGTGAAWSAGSVALNNPTVGGPIFFEQPLLFGSVVSSLDVLTLSGFAPVTGPCLIVFPINISIIHGDPAPHTIVSITDSEGNIWQRIQAPSPWADGTGDPDHAQSYELWNVFLLGGLDPSLVVTVTLSGNSGGVSASNIQSSFGAVRNCTAVDKSAYFLWTATLPGGGTVSGASITTTQTQVIMSVSAVTDIGSPQFHYPSGSSVFFNNAASAGLAASVYGGTFLTPPQAPGTFNPAWGTNLPGSGPSIYQIPLHTLSLVPATSSPGFPTSQTLQSLNFGPPIPGNISPLPTPACGCGCTLPNELPVFGVEVLITGSQDNNAPDAILSVQLQLPDGTLSPTIHTTQLPASSGTVIVGSPSDTWGLTLSASLLSDPNFTVNIVATTTGSETVTFNVAVQIKVFTSPNPPPNIDYLKTYAQSDGDILNLVLGSNGVMYQEDPINNPDVFSAVYSAILPNTFAESCTEDDREFIALSNLLNGTDIPYTYNGTNFDRLSQVGPGAPPSISFITTSYPIAPAPNGLTQPPINAGVKGTSAVPGRFQAVDWANAPATGRAAGNILTIFYAIDAPDPLAVQGNIVELTGMADINGQNPNGTYVIIANGFDFPSGAAGTKRYWFAVAVQGVTNKFIGGPNDQTGNYQITQATVTTTVPIPNIVIGSQIQITGADNALWDGTWTVTGTPTNGQLAINQTSLSGNVATYAFTLLAGSVPTVGQQVSILGCINGPVVNGTSIFNVANAVITAVGPGTFSIALTGADVPVAAENGSAITAGTQFTFDPGTGLLGSATNPGYQSAIFGNSGGGEVLGVGVIASGLRQVCYSFLTRNGYLTQPSPIAMANITLGAQSITISGLATGPDDVIARVVHLTAANGGNFYNIPIPVTVNNGGQEVVNSSTYVNDNTSTTVTLSFSDAVLLAADQIDTQGNNLFETLELGSSIGLITYGSRVFAWGEQNKIPNLLNYSFDGGAGGAFGSVGSYPFGWTVDPTNGGGGAVVNSPIFGWAYQIQNLTGITQALYGMIWQGAFEDEFKVPIVRASTTYSVRLTASAPTAIASGNLVVDLYSPSFAKSFGAFLVPLVSLTATSQIFTGTMLTTSLSPVPPDLILRIYASAIPTAAQILLDRVEPFPTEQPVLTTDVIGSYVNNFEAFDAVTGIIGTATENPQAVRSAFTLFDSLYLVKTGSFVSTQDNGTTEPEGWSLRTVSNTIGTPSIYGVTTNIDEPNAGEAWAIIAGEAGAFIFNGGEPIKVSEEIQRLWNYINWRYGHTLWVKNDIINRRVLFAVPLKTPNPWLPTGFIADDSNPTTPNVILELSYRQLNTGAAVTEKPGVHVSYSGRLIASEFSRKWSIWTIKAPCAAFLERGDNTEPLFLGNSDGNGKVFELVEGLMQDDCSPIHQQYITYGFVTPEQEQGLRLGSVRKVYTYMTTFVNGTGPLILTVYPNDLTSNYAHALLPNLVLPLMTDGDIEVPINETASRLFVGYECNQIGAAFELARLVMVMSPDPWSAIRGRNG